MTTHESKIVAAVRSLAFKRYPNLLINLSSKVPISDDSARAVADSADLHLMDFRDDVLPNNPNIKLGAYTRSEFQEWLNSTATQHAGLLLINADVLISTWDESVRKAFFREFLLNGVNYGPSTVLVSWLGSSFELEEIHNGEIKVLNMNNLDFMEG